MSDLIDRQAAIDAFERFIHELGINDEPHNYGEMALSKDNVPSVKSKHQTGKWCIDDRYTTYKYYCSVCKLCHRAMYDFCPTCGADMRE